jgi:hypothetical protein
MGKNTKRVKEFIESIPDEKLTGFVTSGGTIYKDTDFRLDMQGVSWPLSIVIFTANESASDDIWKA